MDPVIEHHHLHKFLYETEFTVISECDCGHTMIEHKSQKSFLPLGGFLNKKEYQKPKLSSSYRRRIFGAASQIPLDFDELHGLVILETGQEHISLLTKEEAEVVLKKLQSIWNKKPGRISDKQLAKIYKLGYLLHWNKPAINKYCKRITKKSNIKKLSIAGGHKLIKAMEAMIAHDRGKQR